MTASSITRRGDLVTCSHAVRSRSGDTSRCWIARQSSKAACRSETAHWAAWDRRVLWSYSGDPSGDDGPDVAPAVQANAGLAMMAVVAWERHIDSVQREAPHPRRDKGSRAIEHRPTARLPDSATESRAVGGGLRGDDDRMPSGATPAPGADLRAGIGAGDPDGIQLSTMSNATVPCRHSSGADVPFHPAQPPLRHCSTMAPRRATNRRLDASVDNDAPCRRPGRAKRVTGRPFGTAATERDPQETQGIARHTNGVLGSVCSLWHT